MKKNMNILFRASVLTLVLIMSVGISINATDWTNLFTEDYTNTTDGPLPETNLPELKASALFGADVRENALHVKSKNECYIQYKINANVSANSHGIQFKNNAAASVLESPIIGADGNPYYVSTQSDNAVLIEDIAGKKGARLFQYARQNSGSDEWQVRGQIQRYLVDAPQLQKDKNNYEVELEYYYKSTEGAQKILFAYVGAGGTDINKNIVLPKEDIVSDRWTTWKFTLNDADFKSYHTFDAGYKWATDTNITLSIPSNYETELYIHRISIKPLDKLTPDFNSTEENVNKTVVLPLTTEEIRGNTKLTFDMLLPESELCTSDLTYNHNDGSNAMTVSLSDENKVEVATLEYDVNMDSQNIYAVSTDGEGNRTKNLLYTGTDVFDKNLTYALTLDWQKKTYDVEIKNGNTAFASGSGYKVNNLASTLDKVCGKFMTIKHSPVSTAALSIFDNIVFDTKEDPSYLNAKEDLDAVDLGLEGSADKSFALPTLGSVNGSKITWESSNTDAITISTENDEAVVNCLDKETEVTLTATAELNSITTFRKFKVKVAEHADHIKVVNDVNAINIVTLQGGIVEEDFVLPLAGGNGSSISWASDNGAIAIDGEGNAVLTLGTSEAAVKLTATATLNGFAETKEFNVTVAKHPDYIKAEDDANAIILDIPEGGRVKENFILPGVGSINGNKITWTSDNAAITLNDGAAEVVRTGTDIAVKLTATIKVGSHTHTREFNVTVISLSNVFAQMAPPTITQVDGKLNITANVKHPGKEGMITFVAYSIDKKGAIIDCKIDQKTIAAENIYYPVTFNITGLTNAGELKYYLMDDKFVSYENSVPSDIKNFKADGRVTGVMLTWDASADDNNALSHYAVYKDDTFIGQSTTNSFFDDTTKELETYSYFVKPIDTNDLEGLGKGASATTKTMYYIDYSKYGENDFKYGFDDFQFSASTDADKYAYYTTVVDANGVESKCVHTPNKMIILKTDGTKLDKSIKEFTIEVEYFDIEGSFRMTYNGIVPKGESDSVSYARRPGGTVSMTNTRTWKKAVLPISDVEFKASGNYSGGDFGFSDGKKGIYIRKVRIIPTAEYGPNAAE